MNSYSFDTIVAKEGKLPSCERPNMTCRNDTSQCITVDQFCDGVAHCADGSDEKCLGTTSEL